MHIFVPILALYAVCCAALRRTLPSLFAYEMCFIRQKRNLRTIDCHLIRCFVHDDFEILNDIHQ